MSNEFWMDEKEQEFFMSFITPETELLEYGSGNSTLFLQDKVKRMVSVEHNKEWFDKLAPQLGEKVTYIYEKPNNDHWENQYTLGLTEDGNVDAMKNAAGDDGTFEDFISYVISPSRHGKFDIVFIDGRARVSCAWMSTFLLKDENSRIVTGKQHMK